MELRRLCVFIVFSGALVLQVRPCVAQRYDVRVLADGGRVIEQFSGWNRYADFQLTVTCENRTGASVSLVRGEILHPYGTGPFEITLGEKVLDSDFFTNWERIRFELRLDASATETEPFLLFVARPVTDSLSDLGRPAHKIGWLGGAYQAEKRYPAPLTWESLEILDAYGNNVAVRGVTDPVIEIGPILRLFYVTPQGFPDKVASVAIFSINGVELHPPWGLEEREGYFALPTFAYQCGSSHSVTFAVRLENGTQYRFECSGSLADVEKGFVLQPRSGIEGWRGMYR